jgi:geranylgeranyl diphosphate synthase type II
MVLGQVRDLEAEKQAPDLEKVEAIHATKTAAMIRAAFEAGALTARAPEETRGRMAQAGEWIGLAFQVVDDLLDLESTREQLGKSPGKDLARGKMTYPAAVGVEAARKAAEEMTSRALRLLKPPDRFLEMKELVLYMLRRTH